MRNLDFLGMGDGVIAVGYIMYCLSCGMNYEMVF